MLTQLALSTIQRGQLFAKTKEGYGIANSRIGAVENAGINPHLLVKHPGKSRLNT